MKILKPIKRISLTFELSDKIARMTAASGLYVSGDRAYLVADDELFVGIFDFRLETFEQIEILPGQLPNDAIARKQQKPDFESLFYTDFPTAGLIALPSASMPNRVRAVFIPLTSDGQILTAEIKVFDISPLLGSMFIEQESVNIEGAFVDRDRFVLFHRGNGPEDCNRFFEFPKKILGDLIYGSLSPQEVTLLSARRIDIGSLNGIPLTITDAKVFEGRIFVLAAAEDSFDHIQDGEIVGSVLAEIKNSDQVDIIGVIEAQKTEGLHMIRDGAFVNVFVVTDSDSPQIVSELLQYQIEVT